ncbi:carbohydrate sulfotransferase 3-like protein, partial [Leptotrombidium deliense]
MNKYLQLFYNSTQTNESAETMEKVCKTSNLHVIKLTRWTLKQAFEFVDTLNNKETAKIIHLVRDPRAIFNSRFKLDWCMKDECGDIEATCDRMIKDFETFEEMKKLYPNNLLRVKYEQLALDAVNYSRKLFRALNIKFSSD